MFGILTTHPTDRLLIIYDDIIIKCNSNLHTETPSVGVVVTTPSDTVNSGSTVLLVCVAYGTPESPSINWLFNGATILSNSTSCQVRECENESAVTSLSTVAIYQCFKYCMRLYLT